jgi:hypothetical protein
VSLPDGAPRRVSRVSGHPAPREALVLSAVLLLACANWSGQQAHEPAAAPAAMGVSTELVGAAQPCGPSGVQFLGQSEVLDKQVVDGLRIGELSAITYDARDDRYYAVSDAASPDGVNHLFRLRIPLDAGVLGVPAIEQVIRLERPLDSPGTRPELDPEGVAITADGELFIASEGRITGGDVAFQTQIRRYSISGDLQGRLPVPPEFLVGSQGQGTSNLTLESLALAPGGDLLFTASEQALRNDGPTPSLEQRIRILRYQRQAGGEFVPGAQFFYLTDPGRTPADVGMTDLAALSDTDLLVLERGFVAGRGNTARIYRVSLAGAPDIAGRSLDGVQPLPKTLIVDLADCPHGGATLPSGATQPNPLLDNFEGMALGPVVPDGRRALILISDDNLSPVQTTRIVALSLVDGTPSH